MNEIDKIRVKSKNFAIVLVLEFGYCSFLFLNYKLAAIQSKWLFGLYLLLLIALPLAVNISLYLRNKKNLDLIQANNIIIAEILILIFSFKFLI